MKLLPDSEAAVWCERRNLAVDGLLPSTRIRFPTASSYRLRIPIPEDATSTVGLAYTLLMTGVAEFEEGNFEGGLLWLQRWNLWSESIDRAGHVLLKALRGTAGNASDLDKYPAQLFATAEFAQAHAALLLPMVFQWDAHTVPADGQFFGYISHEGYLDLFSCDEQTHEALLQRLQDWKPAELISD